MTLGLSLQAFTQLHVVISLIAIVAGLIALFGMLAARRLPAVTAFFLVMTALTDITGYMFPFTGFKPSYVVGTLDLLLLILAAIALYSKHLAGSWRTTYVVSAVIALYLNVFVLVVQTFQKVPSFAAMPKLAPVVQIAVVLLFIVLGYLAVKRFRTVA
jgi:hypothetical protein